MKAAGAVPPTPHPPSISSSNTPSSTVSTRRRGFDGDNFLLYQERWSAAGWWFNEQLLCTLVRGVGGVGGVGGYWAMHAEEMCRRLKATASLVGLHCAQYCLYCTSAAREARSEPPTPPTLSPFLPSVHYYSPGFTWPRIAALLPTTVGRGGGEEESKGNAWDHLWSIRINQPFFLCAHILADSCTHQRLCLEGEKPGLPVNTQTFVWIWIHH